MAKALFELNPALDLEGLSARFAETGRLQVPDFLTHETAHELRAILAQGTDWGLALQAGSHEPPQSWRGAELRDRSIAAQVLEQVKATDRAAAASDYAFRCNRYSLVEAVQQEWDPGGPHELLLEYLNAPEFLRFMRALTGIRQLVRADGHASCYGPNHFLGLHSDSHVAEGWQIAYVINLTIDEWHPDWGGYLMFYDADGNVETGFMPRFNTLNLFKVPQAHAVSYVPPYAPRGRYAISGWLRNR